MTSDPLTRDEQIVEARRAGGSLSKIADEFDLSVTTIRRICLAAGVTEAGGGAIEEPRAAESLPLAPDPAARPFRVFLGWDDRLTECCKVAGYSLLANASIPVELNYLDDLTCEGFTRAGVTQFSYRRFLVPHLCGYQGRALFADGADTLFLGDVAELAELDMGGKALAVVRHQPPRGQDRARANTSVMLIDCAQCSMWTPEAVARASDDRLMRLRDFATNEIGNLPPEWNTMCVVGQEPPPEAKIAHWSGIAPRCPVGSGDWIDFSKSAVWMEWRERMRRDGGAAA